MADGGSPIGLITGVIQTLSGLFGGDTGRLWSGISGASSFFSSSLRDAFGFISDVVSKIKNALQWVWVNVIKAVLTKILAAYSKLRDLLKRIFGPVLDLIKKLRAFYQNYFNQFVKPMLKVIRQIRQVLQIFKLLGFKWAARLDGDLARIENKIVQAYVTLFQYLNIATSWIQLIVDPAGILRRNPLFAGLIRSAPELRNLMDQVTVHPQTAKELDQSNMHNGWLVGPTSDADKAAMQQRQLSPYLQTQRQSVQDAFDALPGLADQQLG
jgi:hypothetical protein